LISLLTILPTPAKSRNLGFFESLRLKGKKRFKSLVQLQRFREYQGIDFVK